MIPEIYRLKISTNTPFVGRKLYGQWCLIIFAPANQPQWAIRVSKKISPLAVERNRLRRRLTQWLYRHRNQLKAQHILVILRRKPETTDIPSVTKELQSALFNKEVANN